MRITAALSFAVLASIAQAQTHQVTRPEVFLDRPLAADSLLPDWAQVRGYFEKLASECPRVKLETVGKTTEGRDFVLATISSEQNLARLDELKGFNQLIADPRGASRDKRLEALDRGKVFVFISCAMHATECAAPQMAMQFAHDLATSDEEPWKSARDQVVVLLAPSLNPDGLDHVVEWYRRTVGTPYEASELPKLYQLYAGHDNNRDWFMLTQTETRLVTHLLYDVWRPQVYWDVHQQGSKAERMFVPPFRDPLDPNLDPGIITAINLLGTRAQLDMTREGKTGVATGGTFDMWWNGGNRNVPVRHNIVGLLTETASARLASPMFLQLSDLTAPDGLGHYAASNRFPSPWPGGWWRVRDIVDYELAFARSLIGSLARERRFFLTNALEAADRALAAGREGAPSGWLIPPVQRDLDATKRLVDVLFATGVEMESAHDAFDADARAYPAGTIVIPRAQPYGAYVKDLFEAQHYPDGADAPYDIAGWTLPLLLGVDTVEVIGKLPEQKGRVIGSRGEKISGALSGISSMNGSDIGEGNALNSHPRRDWKQLFKDMKGGAALVFEKKSDAPGGIIPRTTDVPLNEKLQSLVERKMPRIALYSPWSGDVDEGWMRWVLETFGVPYTTVRNESLRAGDLSNAYDVIILPGTSATVLDAGRAEGSAPDEYTNGLEAEGAVAIERFVKDGGTLITIGASSKFAIDLFGLPLVDVTTDAKEFSCPGSVLRGVVEGNSAYVAGLDESPALFFSRSSAWREMNDEERKAQRVSKDEVHRIDVLLRYAPTRLLLSGWIRKPETIEGRIAWARATVGRGAVHLFAFRPQYRGWTQADFPLLFRALLLR